MTRRRERYSRAIAAAAAVIAVPMIWGCAGGGTADSPAERPATTPLVAGRYFGVADCTATAQIAGETMDASPGSTEVEAEIDSSGFPLQDGTAIEVGDVRAIEILGGSLQGTITEIRLDGEVLVVVRELAGTFAEGIPLHGNSVDEYRSDGDTLTVSITTTVSAGAVASLRQACTGQLTRQ